MFGKIKKNKGLRRDYLVSYINSKYNWYTQDISELSKDILQEILDEMDKYKYHDDDRFFTYGRLDFLEKELSEYAEKKEIRDAFVNLYEYITFHAAYFSLACIPEGVDRLVIVRKSNEYIADGIICLAEKNKIVSMIKVIMDAME